MIRWVRFALGALAFVTFAASAWTLLQSPFAEPYRDRGQAELRVALERLLGPELSPERLASRIDDVLDAGNVNEAAALGRLAEERGVQLPGPTQIALAEAMDASKGVTACLACAWDPANCASFTQVAACSLPAELTPLGDLNAIRRGARDWLAGEEIDRIDLSLGLVGLAATGAILFSAGSSASVKAGATGLRVARHAGALTPAFGDELGALALRAIDWDRLGEVALRRAEPGMLLTPAAGRLSAVAADVGRIGTRMDAGQTLALLRYAESSDDLARIARIAETAGTETAGVFALLGKARVFRATKRLTEMALMTVGLVSALAAQVLAVAFWLVRRWLRRLDSGRKDRQGMA